MLRALTKEDVSGIYEILLGRKPESEEVIAELINRFSSIPDTMLGIIDSQEYKQRQMREVLNIVRSNQDISQQNIETLCDPETLKHLLRRVEETFQHYGEVDPYWSVLTDERFRKGEIDRHIDEFFETGRGSAELLKSALLRNGIAPDSIRSVLELGCGVGRVTVHLADLFEEVVAVDISRAHLGIARQVIHHMGKTNVRYEHMSSFSVLDHLPQCDALYTVIALQHNPPPVMRVMLDRLLQRVRPGGVAYFQVPVLTPGYSYSVKEHLSKGAVGIEQHVLPQREVFRLLSSHGFDVLEALPDAWLGMPHVSCSFLAQRCSQTNAARPSAHAKRSRGVLRFFVR